MQEEAHTLAACPLRSVASLTVEENVVQSATVGMINMLGYDPTHSSIDTLWQLYKITDKRRIVRTLSSTSPRTLCICTHGSTIVCSDITVLEQAHNYRSEWSGGEVHPDLTIVRLTPYGAIDGVYGHVESFLQVGMPLMRFIHNDDIPRLCAGLSQAASSIHQRYPTTVTFDARYLVSETEERPFRFTVLASSAQQPSDMLCILHPIEQSQQENEIIMRPTWQLIQTQLWTAVEKGITVLVQSLAMVLMLCMHSWHTAKTQLTPLVRVVVAEAKSRPELDRIFSWIEWVGLFKNSPSLALQSPH